MGGGNQGVAGQAETRTAQLQAEKCQGPPAASSGSGAGVRGTPSGPPEGTNSDNPLTLDFRPSEL